MFLFYERYSKYAVIKVRGWPVTWLFIFTDPDSEPFPLPFATALFSFLYHLASYESGMFEILNI